MAWAAAKPADSKPIPLNNVFASTTASKAGVTTLAFAAANAWRPFSNKVASQARAIASEAIVGVSPTIVFPWASITARASTQVARASAIPETSKRTGEWAITFVSIKTNSGFFV